MFLPPHNFKKSNDVLFMSLMAPQRPTAYAGATEVKMTNDNKITFDFGDGEGPVPAHRHENGGGWVADTAMVHEKAWVEEDSVVCSFAMVGDAIIQSEVHIGRWAIVGHNSTVCMGATVDEKAVVAYCCRIGEGTVVEEGETTRSHSFAE